MGLNSLHCPNNVMISINPYNHVPAACLLCIPSTVQPYTHIPLWRQRKREFEPSWSEEQLRWGAAQHSVLMSSSIWPEQHIRQHTAGPVYHLIGSLRAASPHLGHVTAAWRVSVSCLPKKAAIFALYFSMSLFIKVLSCSCTVHWCLLKSLFLIVDFMQSHKNISCINIDIIYNVVESEIHAVICIYNASWRSCL